MSCELGDVEIGACLRRIQVRFAWPEGFSRFRVVRRWKKAKRHVVLLETDLPEHPMLILKVLPHLTQTSLDSLHQGMCVAASALASLSPGDRIVTPRSLGWDPKLSAVVMPYIEGSEIGEWLVEHWDQRELVDKCVTGCGRALGRLHTRLTAAKPPSDPEIIAAREDLVLTLARLSFSRSAAEDLARAAVFQRGHGDFVTSNAMVDRSGRIAVIDLPSRLSIVAHAHDIAMFFFALRRTVGRLSAIRSARVYHTRLRELEHAFLRGYEAEVPFDGVDSKPVLRLVRILEAHRALARVKVALRNRRPVSAAQHAIWAAGVRVWGRAPFLVRTLLAPSLNPVGLEDAGRS